MFNKLVRAAREAAAALGIRYTPGEGHGYAGLPELGDDDRAVTGKPPGTCRAMQNAGLMPGTEVGGIQATIWRERGGLQVDVLLEDADPGAWVTEGGEVAVTITVAGLVVYQGRPGHRCSACATTAARRRRTARATTGSAATAPIRTTRPRRQPGASRGGSG